jgi:hypothetical protein
MEPIEHYFTASIGFNPESSAEVSDIRSKASAKARTQ